jgi:hypothetical protein
MTCLVPLGPRSWDNSARRSTPTAKVESTLALHTLSAARSSVRGSLHAPLLAGLETIAELPRFTDAKTREIGTRRTEIRDLLKPHLSRKIERNEFEEGSIPTVTIFIRELERL